MFSPKKAGRSPPIGSKKSGEFVELGPGVAKSALGFVVAFRPPGGVEYSDSVGRKIRVDSEMNSLTFQHGLYAKSRDLRSMTPAQADEILANIQRAMNFLGRATEILRD